MLRRWRHRLTQEEEAVSPPFMPHHSDYIIMGEILESRFEEVEIVCTRCTSLLKTMRQIS